MKELIEQLVEGFTVDRFVAALRRLNPEYAPSRMVDRGEHEGFRRVESLGSMDFASTRRSLVVYAIETGSDLDERRGRKRQYDFAKTLLRSMSDKDSGLFVFYDSNGRFRLSFIHEVISGARRRYSPYRRFTFFVDRRFTNKTFINQLSRANFSTFAGLQAAFSVTAVTRDFYAEFLAHFEAMEKDIFTKEELKKADDSRKDFALLFAIRIIFLGFVQKRRWLADDPEFLANFWGEYHAAVSAGRAQPDTFYVRWLRPLFHEALNSAPGPQVAYRNNEWSKEWGGRLQMLPWLDGGLFQERSLDKQGFALSDKTIAAFFDFLFSYNFTIEENTLDDSELGLNPEFLGIIFERLINKENGAVYTPRTEVDFMCRMALVQWLRNRLGEEIGGDQLYKLFFREMESGSQTDGEFTVEQAERLLALLREVAVCDPAVGSGAFPVGMLHVLEETQSALLEMLGRGPEAEDRFALRKNIIFNSLHGVDVAEWAVWICQLRLWITLFIDAPDALKMSLDPILPALDFKMRVGDSLVQRVGTKLFPVEGYPAGGRAMQERIRQLKKLKRDYFDKPHMDRVRLQHQETRLYSDIIGAEIRERQRELDQYRADNADGSQSQLFGASADAGAEQRNLFEEKIGELESEIRELREMSNGLLNERPLVWSIEFADIFNERGGFDIVIGNPPYIRQESIEDPLGKMEKAEYKAALKEVVGLDFKGWDKKVDGKSDLYVYFYIRGLKLLNEKGVHVFICSNSWLDVGYGVWLQEFLLAKAPVDYVFDNHAKRSFSDADVNTIISIIAAPRKLVDDEHVTRFVAFRQPYEEVIGTEPLLEIEGAEGLVKNESYRVYPICNRELIESGSDEAVSATGKKMLRDYVGEKWGGKFLRAPDIFFTILEKGRGNMVRLADVADVKFGIKTGANDFFYLTKEAAEEWAIESDFLRPIFKGPRESESIGLDPTNFKFLIFYCNKTRSDLEGTNALKYIIFGEQSETHLRPSTRGRPQWWSIGNRTAPQFIFPAGIGVIYRAFEGRPEILVDKRLYEGYSEHANLVDILNSTFFILCQEINSRTGLGDGLLDLAVYEVASTVIVDPRAIERLPRMNRTRKIENIFVECGIDPESSTPISDQVPSPKDDRKQVDDVIFDVLGLTADERNDVYRGVCQLVWNRVSRADSV